MRKFLHRSMLAVLTIVSFMVLTSCFALPVEPAAFEPPTFRPPPPRQFRTIYAARGDVRLMTTVFATYTFVREETLSFDVSMLPIEAIHVEVGDHVRAGDIIVTAGIPGLAEERDELQLELDRILFRLRQAELRHRTVLDVAANSGNPVDDSRYILNIQNIMGEFEIVNLQIERISGLFEGAILIAPIDGIVTHATAFREGMTTTAGARLVSISDVGVTGFLIQSPVAMNHMNFGDTFYVIIGDNEIPLVVVDPDEEGIGGRPEWVNARFLNIDGPPVPLQIGVSGRIELIMEEAIDVVYIPQDIVRVIGVRTFVYIVEDGLRQVRDVEVGVRGNFTEEIISGLNEGDEVIL